MTYFGIELNHSIFYLHPPSEGLTEGEETVSLKAVSEGANVKGPSWSFNKFQRGKCVGTLTFLSWEVKCLLFWGGKSKRSSIRQGEGGVAVTEWNGPSLKLWWTPSVCDVHRFNAFWLPWYDVPYVSMCMLFTQIKKQMDIIMTYLSRRWICIGVVQSWLYG